MNPEVKAMWLDALRSGEYKQTRNRLCDPEGFCCLGVLCDIYLKEHPESNARWAPPWGMYAGSSYEDLDEDGNLYAADEYLPGPVMKWAGLSDDNPDVVFVDDEGRQYETPLSRLNDESGYNFKKIAEIIAQNFGGQTEEQQRSLAEQIQEDIIAFSHSQDPPLLDQSTLDNLCEIVVQNFQRYESND